MRTRKIFLALLIMAFFIVGCATLGLKVWSDNTPKEKSTAMFQFYNSTYKNTMKVATDPTATPAAKKAAMEKKKVLMELWPLIGAYDNVLISGGIPSVKDEQKILDLVDKLGGKL